MMRRARGHRFSRSPSSSPAATGRCTPCRGSPPLLDRAIVAAGGAERSASIRAIEARSRGEQLWPGYRSRCSDCFPTLSPRRGRLRRPARAGDRRRPKSGRRSTTTRSRSRPRRPIRSGELAARRRSRCCCRSIDRRHQAQEEGRGDETARCCASRFRRTRSSPATPRARTASSSTASTSLLRRIEFDAMIFGARRARGPDPHRAPRLPERRRRDDPVRARRCR